MNYSIKPVVISSVLRLQMNAIFYALILDKNKLSSIHKTHTHKLKSKVLHILRLLVEVNAVVISINKIKCKLIIKNRK